MLSPPVTARRPAGVVGGAAVAAFVQLSAPMSALARARDFIDRDSTPFMELFSVKRNADSKLPARRHRGVEPEAFTAGDPGGRSRRCSSRSAPPNPRLCAPAGV